MAAFLHRCQLVFEVYGRCTGLNHRFHQLKRIKHAAKPRFRVGDDRQEIIGITRIVRLNTRRPLDLIRAAEAVVDPIDHGRYRVRRIERLIRIHAGGQVGVRCDLPAGKINRFNARFRLLQRLAAGQRAQAVDVAFFRFPVQQSPHLCRAQLRQSTFRVDRAAQLHHIFGAVWASNAFPARIRPLFV